MSTKVLAARLPGKVHGRDRTLEIYRFPEAPNEAQAELTSVGIADFFRYLNSYLERYNSETKSLDFATDDPAGLSASELEPSPDGAAAGVMRRATGNSETKAVGLKGQLTYTGSYVSCRYSRCS